MAKKATTKPATKKTAAKSTNGKSSSGSNGDGASPSAAGTEAQQLDPAVLEKITELRSKVNETFGQVALAMMAIPRYRHQSVGDLDLRPNFPPLLSRACQLVYKYKASHIRT